MILLLILTASIGAAYYRLAHDHYRSAWGFAVLGGGVFIASQFLLGFILGLIIVATGNADWLVTSNPIVLSLIGYAFAGICCGVLYMLLKKNWSKNPKNQREGDRTIDNF